MAHGELRAGAYLDYVQAHLNVYRFVRASDPGTGPTAVRRVKDTVGTRVTALARDYLVLTGRARAEGAETLALGLVGLVDAVVNGWLEDPAGLERDELVRRLVLMVRGAGEAVAADHRLPAPS